METMTTTYKMSYPAATWDRDTHEKVASLILPAMAEVGHPMVIQWIGDRHGYDPVGWRWTEESIALFDKAAMMALDAMGIEYTLLKEDGE